MPPFVFIYTICWIFRTKKPLPIRQQLVKCQRTYKFREYGTASPRFFISSSRYAVEICSFFSIVICIVFLSSLRPSGRVIWILTAHHRHLFLRLFRIFLQILFAGIFLHLMNLPGYTAPMQHLPYFGNLTLHPESAGTLNHCKPFGWQEHYVPYLLQ